MADAEKNEYGYAGYSPKELILEQAPLLEAFLNLVSVNERSLVEEAFEPIENRIDRVLADPSSSPVENSSLPTEFTDQDIAFAFKTLIGIGFELDSEEHVQIFLGPITNKLKEFNIFNTGLPDSEITSSAHDALLIGTRIRRVEANIVTNFYKRIEGIDINLEQPIQPITDETTWTRWPELERYSILFDYNAQGHNNDENLHKPERNPPEGTDNWQHLG